ncbi:MAG: hypothetical protein V7K25_09335 [Nostoc sp.]|uniref:hypothetical protein n=1 Tax=Nostoc sp. TaxID=1180 RepID=UPI002FFB8991
MQVQEAFYSYGRSYQILAVGTHAKSARDLEIMLRLFDRSNFRDFQEINYSKKRTTETRQRGLGGFPHERLPRRERREKK